MPGLIFRLLFTLAVVSVGAEGFAGPIQPKLQGLAISPIVTVAMSACQRCKVGCNAKSGAIERQTCLAGCDSSCKGEDIGKTIKGDQKKKQN